MARHIPPRWLRACSFHTARSERGHTAAAEGRREGLRPAKWARSRAAALRTRSASHAYDSATAVVRRARSGPVASVPVTAQHSSTRSAADRTASRWARSAANASPHRLSVMIGVPLVPV